MSLGARYLMKDQSGWVLWFKRVRGEESGGNTGQLCGARGEDSVIERRLEKEKRKENWMKPRKKCADCNLSENGKWDMRERVREAIFYYLTGGWGIQGGMQKEKGIGCSWLLYFNFPLLPGDKLSHTHTHTHTHKHAESCTDLQLSLFLIKSQNNFVQFN